jgi:transcriptional regulator with XRE-family HTH domain
MASRERASDRGARTAHRDLVTVGSDIRTARVMAGLTQRDVGRACGVSHTTIGRIERADLRAVSAVALARIGAVVGLDVRVKAYPGATPIRDAAQTAHLVRLRARLHASLRLTLEVPIQAGHEQRAWDAQISGFERGATTLPVEAETRLYDIQAQVRRLGLKRRDDGAEHVVLLVADTRTNRRIVREARLLFSEMFPVPGRRALAALARGDHPGGSALILL